MIDAGLKETSVVLDLATGPGRLALRLAPAVHKVIAVDIEPEMLSEGARLATDLSINNVEWTQARAEDVELSKESLDLVTIGEAIHRLDQDLVLSRTTQWLKQDAPIAIVGSFGVLHGSCPWQDSLRHSLKRWTHPQPQSDSSRWRGENHDTARLAAAGFQNVQNRKFNISHTWTSDSILGNLLSTSRFSQQSLGDDLEDFEHTVRNALSASGEEMFCQTIPCGYTIGWNTN